MLHTINEREQDHEGAYRQLLAHVWADNECWGDYTNWKRCMEQVKHYDRYEALLLLREMLIRYQVQIDEWAYLCGGQYMQPPGFYDDCTSMQIICDLHYIGFHIPAYALLREGRNEEAENLMHWMEDIFCRRACHREKHSV